MWVTHRKKASFKSRPYEALIMQYPRRLNFYLSGVSKTARFNAEKSRLKCTKKTEHSRPNLKFCTFRHILDLFQLSPFKSH